VPIEQMSPMKVHHSQITGAHDATSHAGARAEAQKKASGVSFAEQLASASTKKKTSKTDAKATTPPKGEVTSAVPGHADYRDIVAGPREGMYLNTSGNVRNGEAFVLVKRHGVEYHIYGTGKHKRVIAVKHHHATPPASSAPTASAPTSGTTDTSSTTTSSPTQATPTA
jgi:hypothetical protein